VYLIDPAPEAVTPSPATLLCRSLQSVTEACWNIDADDKPGVHQSGYEPEGVQGSEDHEQDKHGHAGGHIRQGAAQTQRPPMSNRAANKARILPSMVAGSVMGFILIPAY
jgi:hypothetical protein